LKGLRNNLITYAKTAIKRLELEQDLKKEAESRNQLQTKYDMEVRSKEELVNELKNIRPDVIQENEKIILDIIKKDSVSYQNRRQVKKELDEKGFGKNILGSNAFPHLGFFPFLYLYRNWSVPLEPE
jgi:hypothetical protein